MMRNRMISLVIGSLLASTGVSALADHWHGHFHERDVVAWRGGHWMHGPHFGRDGWWWVAGGMWYFYPAPIYPYPDFYRPPVVVEQVPVAPVQVTPAPPAPAPVVQNWYYCEETKQYYPYVSSCNSGWKAVPATPPAPPANR